MADVEQDGALGEEGFDEGMEDDMIPMEGAESLEEQGIEDVNALKKRLAEMEAEAANMRSTGEDDKPVDASGSGDGAVPMSEADQAEKQAAKEEVDSRSIFVGNVDYAVTPEQLQQHFQSCGTVNRVTILVDKAGNPKAYAYIEFLEVDAVANAILLDSTELNGRALKVSQKRTNLPFRKARGRGGRYGGGGGRGGGFAPYGGGYGFGGFMPPPYGGRGYGGYGYGAPPRGRGGRARGRGRGGRFYQPY